MEDDDFGFSLSSTEKFKKDLDSKNTKTQDYLIQVIEDMKKDIDLLRAAVEPFLNNLAKDPSSDIIQWEGTKRVESIRQFKVKLDRIVENAKRRKTT